MLVFELSSRCNLECVYCNAEAGPLGVRPVLDPEILEKWVEAFGSFAPSIMSVQLHGGEPLIVDPPVELYAAIVRNTLARFPNIRLDYLGVQSNGSALNERRARNLEAVGLSIDISIDGPASIHDRHRSSPGRSNHREAVRAHHLLRARGKHPGVIAVATDPQHVVPAVEFFLEDGFREVRMNVVRPEGRALRMRQWDDPSVMHAMAWEYFRAAKLISEHNMRRPDASFFEFNLASLMQILIGESRRSDMMYWSFLVDDRGRLWSHPCGFYATEGLRLTDDGPPSRDALRHVLGLEACSGVVHAPTWPQPSDSVSRSRRLHHARNAHLRISAFPFTGGGPMPNKRIRCVCGRRISCRIWRTGFTMIARRPGALCQVQSALAAKKPWKLQHLPE